MRAFAALLFAVAVVVPGTLRAGQAAGPAPGTPPAEAAQPLDESVLTIGDTALRMTVPVMIAGAGPFPFIIDTGAQRTVISRELAATLGLARGRDVRLTAMTGTSSVGTVLIPSLSVSNVTSRSIEAPALLAEDLGAPGLLGIDALGGQALAIDLEASTMTIRSAERRRRAKSDDEEIVVRAKSAFGQLIVTHATYRGRRISVVIDTGTAVSMGNMALRARMSRELKTPRQIVLTSVTGDSLTAEYTQIRNLVIGGIDFNNLPIAFADAEPFRRFGLRRDPALLLGMDALRLFRRVELDFANREVRFALPRRR
jgi:predicted aspartyl protease